MLSSIRKFSKTIIAKIFLVIIIIPFVFWGMGGVFNSGNSNNIVKINNLNISTQDFIDHLNNSNLNQDFIRTARSKGVSEKVVVIKHALRNSLLPLVTILGLRLGRILGGAIILETMFVWPGLGALSVTDIPIFRKQYSSLIKPYFSSPSPDLRLKRKNQNSIDFTQERVSELKKLFEDKHEVISSIILEPLIQCATGMGMYESIYLKKVRELCDEYKIHLIIDEIAVGFGRTGKMFAHQYEKIIPDFICLSKGLTGGYLPLSVTLTKDSIFEAFYSDKIEDAFLHSHSYTGNPLACSAALGTLSIFETEDVFKNNKNKANLINKLMNNYKNLPIKNFRHMGMIWAFELDHEVDIDKFIDYSISNGVLIRPINNTVYFMPPYCITENESNHMVRVTYDAIKHGVK